MNSLPRAFGKYTLERRLGVGGMAETFVARREGPGGIEQLLCVKRVLPAFNSDQTFRQQFQREARLAATLRHSNIVGTLDFGSVAEVQYMALELVEGVDLRGLLSSQPNRTLSTDLMTLIVFELAHALEYAHEPRGSDGGIVHRDVTPSNVLLSIEGGVKLADFGVAKALGGSTVATATGIMKGKMPYMPPEQMKGGDIDGRVDLFSLGVLFFEGLAGRRPFVGAHDVEVMTKILSGDRPSILELVPDLAPGLATVIESLLQNDRDQRIGSATELIDALVPYVPDRRFRDRLASLVRTAYGEEVHAGKGSDTHMDVANDLPLALPLGTPKPRADAFARTMVSGSDPAHPSLLTSPERPSERPPPAAVPRATLTGGGMDPVSEEPTPPAGRLIPGTFATETAPQNLRLRDEDLTGSHGLQPSTRPLLGLGLAILLLLGVGLVVFFRQGPETAATLTPEPETAAALAEHEPEAATDPLEQTNGGAGSIEPLDQDPSDEEPATEEPSDEEPTTVDRRPRNPRRPRPGTPVDTAHASNTTLDPRPETVMDAVQNPHPDREVTMAEVTMTEVTMAEVTMAEVTMAEARPRGPAPATRRVRITVRPGGNVWVDNRYMGPAPTRIQLTRGTHRISVGRERPEMHRTVNIVDTREPLNIRLQLPQ